MSGGGAAPRWVLLLASGEPARLREAAAMTAAAVSLGIDVTLVWLSDALDSLVSGRLEAAADEPGGAARLFAEAREAGGVRSFACSAAMVRSRVPPERVREKVDEIVGWPTVISAIRAAERSFVW
ncbi:MAG TPA: DsrE family protein [Thermoanaerobaculia bacterium]|nr:DsrE family protein [Thermoanaerobaculia bacterium]